jgi:ethylbenzene hydroxylase subunit beta/complex iron-sulfur molybdoenzyme family reductase subunit beta
MSEKKQQPSRQIAWVFDLNKCSGCQTCSVACKVHWTFQEGAQPEGTEAMWWCTVNTQPGRGSPRDYETMGGGYDSAGKVVLGRLPTEEEYGKAWDFNWEEVYYAGKGREAFLEPSNGRPTWGMNWDEDQGAGEYPNAYFFYLPRICNHCSEPACLEACPNGAIYKREVDGLVLRDEARCKGDRACMKACPYKKIYFNPQRRIGQHCIGCFPRLERGVAPACVRQCPGRAVFIGFLDDDESPVTKLVRRWRVALPLHPEWNTQPNVFYVPPLSPFRLREDLSVDEKARRLPVEYLESLFGPEVRTALHTLEEEISRRRQGEASELLNTLIAYDWNELLGPFTAEPAGIVWD